MHWKDIPEHENYQANEKGEIRTTGINHTCIINVCKGKQKTAGKYKWEY